jgi:fatty acid desaturase
MTPAAAADWAALVERFRARGLFAKATGRILAELAVHVVLMLGGLAVFARADGGALRAAGLLVSTYGGVGVLSSSHTSSHDGTSARPWVNRALTRLGFTFVFQISTAYWRRSHLELHHPHPNVDGLDCDADLAPWFVLNRRQLERSPRLARWYYRLQWAFFPPALALNLPSAQVASWLHLLGRLRDGARRRVEDWIDLGVLALHWAAWLLVPMAFFAPGDVVGTYLLRMALMGYGMFLVAAPAHYPAEAVCLAAEGAGADVVLRQTAATLDFRTGPLGALLASGADHQVEHHLFPEVSHVHYRAMRSEVEAFCRAHGSPYRRLGWLEAVWKSYRTLVDPKPVATNVETLRAASRA